MQKTYQRINWENYPSESTPINETNLNAMDYAVDELDNRVITHETTKATKTEVSTVITDVSFNENTGTFTFTRKNGGTVTIDTILEKMMINFRYDYENQRLVITLDDGSVQYVDMSALLTQYEFADSDTLAFSLTNGKISAIVKNGSIQEKHLRPEYLAAIKVESAKAESSAKASATSEANAKAYSEQAKASADRAEEVVGITYATEEKAGIVSPQDIYVNPQNGEMSMTKHTTSPTLTNSRAGGIKLNLGGVSEQKQYSGKNQVDLSAWEFNDSEYAHQYLISSDVTAKALYDFLTENVGKQIVLSMKTTGTDYSAPIGSIYAYDSSSTLVTTIIPNTACTIPELPENVSSFVVYGSPNSASISDIQVEFGEVATDHEPYVGGIPAPNPDYPQEINSVVVSEIKAVGAQLWSNDTDFTVSAVGKYDVNLEAGTYTLSCLVTSTDTDSDKCHVYDSTNNVSIGYFSRGNRSSVTFTTEKAISKLYLYASNKWDNSKDDTAIYTDFMINSGSTALPFEPYTESVVTLSEPITLDGIGESIDILTPENVKRRFYTERVTTYMLALKEVNYNDTNTKGFTIIPSKKCASGEADNIKCTIAIYGSGTEKNTCRIKDSESIAIFLDMGEFPSLSDFSNYLASNEVYITYELAEEITEVLPEADQIALRGLKSFDTVTYISTDSEVEPIIDAEYGTSKVGALALENSLLHEVKDILLAQLSAEQDIMSDYLGAIRYIYLSNTLGATSYQKPWLELEAQFSKMQNGVFYNGLVSAGTQYTLIGRKVNENFATFSTFSYERGEVYHIWKINNVWYHEQLALNSNLTDYMVAVEVEFDFTEVDTFQTVSKDITSLIPVGYKVIDAHGVRGGGDYVFISDISLRDNTLSLALYNPSGNIDSGYPAAKIICVRDI